LLGIVERVEFDGTGPAALKRLHDILVMRRQELPQLDGFFVYDENGNWIINSTSTPLNRFNNSDREYFIFHRYDSGPGPHNVLERGQRLFACGGMAQSGHPMKQEPAEATARLIA
jgi:hypothetical protein